MKGRAGYFRGTGGGRLVSSGNLGLGGSRPPEGPIRGFVVADRRPADLRRDTMRLRTFGDLAGISATCLVVIAMAVVDGRAAGSAPAGDREDDAGLLEEARGHFRRLPKDMATAEFPVTPERVRLGRELFFDPRISADGAVSCSRCHLPALYG